MDIWPQFYLNAFTGFCRYVLLNDQTFQKISASGSYEEDLSILSLTCLNSCSGKNSCSQPPVIKQSSRGSACDSSNKGC